MEYNSFYKYRSISWQKALLRDVITRSRNLLLRIMFGRRSKVILFYPYFPDWYADIYQALIWSKHRLTSNPEEKFDYVVNWDDTTFRNTDQTLKALADEHYILNIGCNDISKEKVEKVFSKIFGYTTFVDPLRYRGKVIEKSDLNSRHSLIKIKSAPLAEVKQGFVYQRFLSRPIDGKMVDNRVTYIHGQIPLVIARYKPPDDVRNTIIESRFLEPLILFSKQEIEKIIEFCHKMKLDYGELDVIRNLEDGLIYIIDVNTTPNQPRTGYGRKDLNWKHRVLRNLFLQQLAVNEENNKPGKGGKLKKGAQEFSEI
jgi:hypothetical protein